MKIAILGGTGDIGEGLALRLAKKHPVVVGSREEAKAKEAADNYRNLLAAKGIKAEMTGASNIDAAKDADIVILAVRYQFAMQTLQSIEGVLDDQIVVTPIVPMSKTKLCSYTPPEKGSAAKQICEVLPPAIRLVSTFHTLPAARLANLDDPLGFDVIVCADDEEAKKVVMGIVADLGNIRPLDGGGLDEARLVEALTPLLVNLAIKNKMKDLSLKFV